MVPVGLCLFFCQLRSKVRFRSGIAAVYRILVGGFSRCALNALRTLGAICSRVTFGPLGALNALNTLGTGLALLPFQTLGTLDTLRALGTLDALAARKVCNIGIRSRALDKQLGVVRIFHITGFDEDKLTHSHIGAAVVRIHGADAFIYLCNGERIALFTLHALDSLGAGVAFVSFVSFGTLNTLGALSTGGAFFSLRSLGAGGSLGTGGSLRACGTCFSLGPLGSGLSLDALGALGTGSTLRALVSLGDGKGPGIHLGAVGQIQFQSVCMISH